MADEVKALASWRTTASGTIAAVLVVLGAVKLGMDGHLQDVSMIQVLEAVSTLAISFGLMAARDNKVSSEQVGIK